MLEPDIKQKINPRRPVVQTTLKVGKPGDKYEREADAVADRVMRMDEKESLQMQPLDQEEEELQMKIRMQPEEEEEEIQMQIQRQPATTGEQILKNAGENAQITPVEKNIGALRGNGPRLSPETRMFFEPRFNYRFDKVKVHTNALAADTATMLGARAFTVGNDIVFGHNQYNPHSMSGKKLLAHELTHVVQQGAARPAEHTSNQRISQKTGRLTQANLIQTSPLDALAGTFRDFVTNPATAVSPVESVFSSVVSSNRALASRITIPASWMQALVNYASANLMDGVVLLSALSRSPAFFRGGWIMGLQPNAAAMTLNHSIFIPSGSTISLTTYIHELVHVAQYGVLGVTGFLASYFGMSAVTVLYRWLNGLPTNAMRSSPHENQAYDLAARFRSWYRSTNGTDPSTLRV